MVLWVLATQSRGLMVVLELSPRAPRVGPGVTAQGAGHMGAQMGTPAQLCAQMSQEADDCTVTRVQVDGEPD